MKEINDKGYTVEYTIKIEDNGICLRVHCNGRAFDIEYGPQDLYNPANKTNPRALEQEYLDALHHIFGDDDDEPGQGMDVDDATDLSDPQDQLSSPDSSAMSECGYEESPVVAFTMAPFLSHGTLETFASKSSTPCLNTLHDVLHPPLFTFSLRVVEGTLVPVNQSPEKMEYVKPYDADVWKARHWRDYPRVKSRDIAMARNVSLLPNTNLVMFNNRICWFKPVIGGIDDAPYRREIDMLFRLRRKFKNLDKPLRFPQLEATVIGERREDMINGLILSAVYPNRGTIADQVEGRRGPSPSPSLCERWYREVEAMVHILHSEGFIWGDVSPNNMIIDEDENVWIADFGGGYTCGWIEPEDMETMKGDLEGLKVLKEYLLDVGPLEDAS
ncbi:uncharacterized protein PV06_02316 [Exophiala oligosperma]|uniref:Protein kinase domain-containing protein n=1 Tax=Exophiala oligosperma TaxID=215243 RepID=A0A0D2EFF4_9EURO|nr:uncharacterized protein PV06_02316 [Exophiala oligosperma]KIW46664.1 hypothetical protein PV06_02316 [Exophiala oligosperma]